MNRMLRSCALDLLAIAVACCGLAACSRGEKPESASIQEAAPKAPVETPPPPEPASALGTASGRLKMADFPTDTEHYAWVNDPSPANLKKAQSFVEEEYQSALASWTPKTHELVIFLFTNPLSPGEVETLKASIAVNGEAIRKRSETRRDIATIQTIGLSYPVPPGNQTAHVAVWKRGTNGRFYSANGPAELRVSVLPEWAPWTLPGRVLPEIELHTSGKSHYGGSSSGESEWQIQVRVPVICTRAP